MSTARMPSTLYPSKRVSALVLVLVLVMSGGAHARIFGIPGTTLGTTLLQAGPGNGPSVITTLFPKTSVQVLCKVEKGDAAVGDDPWWLKVHVWESGMEGYVADFWVQCRHKGFCRVPFCV